MKVTIKSPRANKRKIVVPFAGEENFIVPMQGGFGQPDHEEYISVDNKYANLTAPIRTNSPSNEPTTQTGTGLGTGTIESGNTNTTYTPTPTTTTQTNTPATTTDTTTITPELTNPVSNTPTPSGTVSNETITNPPLTDGTLGSGTSTSGTTTPPRTSSGVANESVTPLPTFPNYSTLDCSALASEISKLQIFINGNTIGDISTANAYNDALASAKSYQTSKCSATQPSPSPIIIAPIPATPIGGGFGGGAGGGFGEPPADETNITEQTTTESGGLSWFWIAVGLTGLYFLTKGSKQ